MYPLRPGNDEPDFEDDEVEPALDAGIVDRLSAYSPGSGTRSFESLGAAEEPEEEQEHEAQDALEDEDGEAGERRRGRRFGFLFRDRAVEEGHAAQAPLAQHEPGEEDSAPGSYELERFDPAPSDEHADEGSPAIGEDAVEADEFALPEVDVPEPGLFRAELEAFDLETEHESDRPEAAQSFDSGAGRADREDDENVEVEPDELAPLESGILEKELATEPELPVAETREPDLPEPDPPMAEVDTEADVEGGDGAELEVDEELAEDQRDHDDDAEVVAAETALVVDALSLEESLEPPSRRSFRRRRGTRPESSEKNREKKARVPKEKRRSRDRKAKRLVGLKIGASQIAAAQVVNNGAPELVEVFREPLEPGLVVSGEIRDPEALAAALKRLFELHKLPKRGVRLGLSNNRIGVRIFEIEGVDDAQQLDNAIRFRAEEVLPIPLDEAVLDYVVLDEAVRDDGTPWKRILLVVAYREVVDRYLQACRSAGIEVVGIDLEAFALLRALEAPMDRGHHAGALVAVAIGHDRTTIAVSTGRHCEFTRVLDWGGWSLNVAIARELDRAPSEVEGVKRQLSFATSTEVEGLTPEQAAKAREAIQRSLTAFVRELVASLQFYQAQPGALGIGEVVLTGGAAHMDGLPEALGELVGVPIRLGDPFKRLKVGPKVVHEGPRGSLSVAIGLGIED